ncbi:DNA-binding response regulator, OmpR family, contains REC and winged-helix (wHTH) domain [Streptococcus equinus]|uniref:DNA-binding response regulator, OmpR family, contains REC and winged-helix (WHTH) domain n=1 Tax=Streptococcus equinus TaxID=1335 RepID=A0A1H0PDJ9_STREI|nr:response regulator transcription factor [Streptococcus equinus]SDP03083.1 DNA-binding response regulator, OmpR family, contains REC and winged-helix (wHTH) domain [Streptococcus equinus]
MTFEDQILNKRILVVDDDSTLNESIKEILISYHFKNISSAFSIQEAYNKLKIQTVDLILLDVMLPDGDGFSFATNIRKTSDIPILFLTAKSNLEDEIRGLKSGGDDYITKPFLPESLIYRIMALLRRTYKENPSCFYLDNCKIDLSQAILIKDNDEHFSFTRIELQILQKLFDNKNYIVSIESLCEAVWGYDYFEREKSLMVHIRNIREKIENNPSKPTHLITIKGLGYKLII